VARIQQALDYADGEINDRLRDGPYPVPLQFNSGATTATRWSATIAGVWLYYNRGQQDDSKEGNKYAGVLKQVYREINYVKIGVRRLDAKRTAGLPSGPVQVW
jgi:hypothetical protein